MAGDSIFVIHTAAVLSFAGSVFRAVALGLLGLFLLLAAERRLPEATRARGRTLARRGLQLATLVLVAVAVFMVAAVVAAVEVIANVLDAVF